MLQMFLGSDDPFFIRQGDARKLLLEMPDQSVDCIFTDPPYNVGIASWDKDFDPADYAKEFRRILKPEGNIIIFTSLKLIGRWQEVLSPLFDRTQFFIWRKTNPMPAFHRQDFQQSCELVVLAWDKGHTWNYLGYAKMHNTFDSPTCGGRERLRRPHHPTQKPILPLLHLLEIATRPGDIVLDPFMGVGSVGVATGKLGRRYIGMELDEVFVDAARMRLDETLK